MRRIRSKLSRKRKLKLSLKSLL